MGDMTSLKFSEPKQSGSFKKITITDQNGGKLMIETEKCFSWGVQKSKKSYSYTLLLVLKSGSETLKTLKEIIRECKEHLPVEDFLKLIYENSERGTTATIYPKLKYYKGNFSTSVYEGDDKEVDPREYLDKRCDVVAMLHIEGVLVGKKTLLSVKVLEAEVSEPGKLPKKRLLSRGPDGHHRDLQYSYTRDDGFCGGLVCN